MYNFKTRKFYFDWGQLHWWILHEGIKSNVLLIFSYVLLNLPLIVRKLSTFISCFFPRQSDYRVQFRLIWKWTLHCHPCTFENCELFINRTTQTGSECANKIIKGPSLHIDESHLYSLLSLLWVVQLSLMADLAVFLETQCSRKPCHVDETQFMINDWKQKWCPQK